jgi:hypothetical protein
MNRIESESQIIRLINSIYEDIAQGKPTIANPIGVEDFIWAFEIILDALDPSTKERPNSYRAFLGERKFGMFTFVSRFCQSNSVTFGLRELDGGSRSHDELAALFREQFHHHWIAYLSWRSDKLSESPSE